MPAPTTASLNTQPARVLILALNRDPHERIIDYAHYLVSQEVEVDLVVADQKTGRGLDVDPRIRVHPLMRAEYQHPVRNVERFLLYRIPGLPLIAARRLAARSHLGRPLRKPLALLLRAHRRIARGLHQRAFMPVYRGMRPWLLAKMSRKGLRGVDCAVLDRIIAADLSAVTLGWMLARRYPGIVATTALDRRPYANRPSVDAAPAAPR